MRTFAYWLLSIIGSAMVLTGCAVNNQGVLSPSGTIPPTGTAEPFVFSVASITPSSDILTPSTPNPESSYILQPLLAADVDRLFASQLYLASISPLRSRFFGGTRHLGYPYHLLREAMIRFPQDPRFEHWQLAAAWIETILGYPEGGQIIINSYLVGVKSGTYEWGEAGIADWVGNFDFLEGLGSIKLTISFPELTSINGQRAVITLIASANGTRGSSIGAYLVDSDSDEFQMFVLSETFGSSGPDWVEIGFGDLTGDGNDDLIIHLRDHNGTFKSERYLFYDLSGEIPRQLPLAPYIGGEGASFEVVQNPDGYADIIWIDTLHSSADSCWWIDRTTLRWNGYWMEEVSVEVLLSAIQIYTPDDCGRVLMYLSSSSRPVESAKSFYFASLRLIEDGMFGEGVPIEEHDRFQYYLALGFISVGEVEPALSLLNDLTDHRAHSTFWSDKAQEVLNDYSKADDALKVCMAAESGCNIRYAFRTTTQSRGLSDVEEGYALLTHEGATLMGLSLFSAGASERERLWVIDLTRENSYRLWIMVDTENGLELAFLHDGVSPDIELPTDYSTESANSTFFEMEENLTIQLVFDEITGVPYVIYHRSWPRSDDDSETDTTTVELFDLLEEGDYQQVIDILEGVPADEREQGQSYLLGLAYELAGNQDAAVTAYLYEWQDCCFEQILDGKTYSWPSGYSVLAQSKLTHLP